MALPAPNFPEDLSPEQEKETGYWINKARVQARGESRPVSQAVRRRPPSDAIKPAVPVDTTMLPLKPTKLITDEELEDMNAAVNREGRFARRLRKFQRANRKALGADAEAASAKGKIDGAINQYKRIKRIVQVIKVASAAGASVGDVLVSAGTFLVTAHVEWIYSKFNANYPFAPWERRLVILVDIVIFLELLALAVVIAVIYQRLHGLGGVGAFK